MKWNYAIVGGGVTGLSIAYNLLKEKRNLRVVVLEKKYVGSGNSTRNAGRFRVHFWSEENAKAAVYSRTLMFKLAKELGWNPLIYSTGYLWLVHDERILRSYEDTNRRLWSKLGYPVEVMDVRDLKKAHPYLNLDGFICGILGPQDGVLHHDFVTYGYLFAFKKLGGEVKEYSEVKDVVVKEGEVVGLNVNGRILECENVVVAAGAETARLLGKIGISLPIVPHRKEECVSEPVKWFMKPLIIDLRPSSQGFHCCQTQRGEVMGSVDYPEVAGDFEHKNTLKYLSVFFKNLINLVPSLKCLRLMRIWPGYYDMTPDNSHILGRDEVWPRGLSVAAGFSGHGFMLAPYVGEVMSKYLLYDEVSEYLRPFLPTRFKEGRLIKETMVIG